MKKGEGVSMYSIYGKPDKVFRQISLLLLPILIYACSAEVNYTPPAGSKDMARHMKIHHAIQLNDIKDLIDDSTKTLIIGIGADSVCSVTDDIVDFSKSMGVDLLILDTCEAVRTFNKLPKKGLSACFHINC
ncbi:MAG: hypothetical protein HGJ94_10365 [Desulfosarcina sp.]|nr:hypothetical protein [Desulfosarcina sp.]